MKTLLTLISVGLFSIVSYGQDQGVVRIDDTVTGNQEQPKVLYIVPWKPASDDSILSQNVTTNVESVFGHVERAEHLRKLEFIEELEHQQNR